MVVKYRCQLLTSKIFSDFNILSYFLFLLEYNICTISLYHVTRKSKVVEEKVNFCHLLYHCMENTVEGLISIIYNEMTNSPLNKPVAKLRHLTTCLGMDSDLKIKEQTNGCYICRNSLGFLETSSDD